MRKAVTLFCLVAVFVAASCASDTEPETNEMTLAERAGVYANSDNTIMLVLRTDGTGTYVNPGAGAVADAVLQLKIGSSDSADIEFIAAPPAAGSDVNTVNITFDASDPSTVDYGVGNTLTKEKF